MNSQTRCLIAAFIPVLFLGACGGAAGLDFDGGGGGDSSLVVEILPKGRFQQRWRRKSICRRMALQP